MRHVPGVFRKAKNNQLIKSETYDPLKDIEPIKLVTSNARPPQKTSLPNIDFLESSLRDMRPTVRDMVLITEYSAMRVDELCQLKPADIDRSDAEIWVYRPPSHKTDRHDGDKPKEIPIGPKSQKILQKYLDADGVCFSSTHGGSYTASGFRQAGQDSLVVTYKKLMGIENLKADINTLSDKQKADFIRNYRWYPRQLRRLRSQRAFDHSGLEATSQLLGHSSMKTTERYYVEPNKAKARAHVRRFG